MIPRARRRIREREQREGFDDDIFKDGGGVGCPQGSNRGNVLVDSRGELSLEARQGIGAQPCDGGGGVLEGNHANGVGFEKERLWQTTARLDPEVRMPLYDPAEQREPSNDYVEEMVPWAII